MAKTQVTDFDLNDIDIAWCPGCGDFGILTVLKACLSELALTPEETVIVSGIGQAGKIPHYMKANFFNGLHGRALPAATAIKVSNPALTVIAASGDGDMYGEGGNHFIHTIRRNPDITNLVHNNMVYGLTKGQASPTSSLGFETPVQVGGVILEPFNPLTVALSLGATFIARANIGDEKQTGEIIKKAILHKGYSLVDIFQPCPTFNKVNTYKWFRENSYYLKDCYGDDYDETNKVEVFKRASEVDKLPLGVFYVNKDKPTFEDNLGLSREGNLPLYRREVDLKKLAVLINKTGS